MSNRTDHDTRPVPPEGATASEELERFFARQLETWPSVQKRYRDLDSIERKTVHFEGFHIDIQYNPARVGSATAKIDAASLRARQCFLCREHLPEEQISLTYNERLEIRVNPYPIFERHFTVPAKRHEPQRIEGHFEEMLDLARRYPDYTVFYNGPESGASAPDHFHFQLVPRHVMPLEDDSERCPTERLFSDTRNEVAATSITAYARKNIMLKGANEEGIKKAFSQVTRAMRGIVPGTEEAMMNLFAWREGERWTVALFPRRKHRPWQFFAEGEDHILFSPGCADFAGLIISPRKADFDRLDAPLLRDLFGQLTLDEEEWNCLKNKLRNDL